MNSSAATSIGAAPDTAESMASNPNSRSQLGEHQFVRKRGGKRVNSSERRAGDGRLRLLPTRCDRPSRQGTLDAGLGGQCGFDAALDLVPEHRHRGERRRPHLGQHVDECLRVLDVDHGHAEVHGGVLAQPPVDQVRVRQV